MLHKEQVLAKLKQEQEQIIKDFETLIERYKAASDIDEDDSKDLEDFARQDINTDMTHNLELQLVQAKNDLKFLENLDKTSKNEVMLGALVETDKYSFIVSIAHAGFELENKNYVALAIDAPIYSYMKGKKVGESFEFNKMSYQILGIA
jgi:hypothetical protein